MFQRLSRNDCWSLLTHQLKIMFSQCSFHSYTNSVCYTNMLSEFFWSFITWSWKEKKKSTLYLSLEASQSQRRGGRENWVCNISFHALPRGIITKKKVDVDLLLCHTWLDQYMSFYTESGLSAESLASIWVIATLSILGELKRTKKGSQDLKKFIDSFFKMNV